MVHAHYFGELQDEFLVSNFSNPLFVVMVYAISTLPKYPRNQPSAKNIFPRPSIAGGLVLLHRLPQKS